MASTSRPQLIFGTAVFGDAFIDTESVQSALDLIKSYGITRLDTAGRYPPTNLGRSEELLGEVNAAEQGFTIDTKILVLEPDGRGHMSREKVENSVSTSLRRMKINRINILHIHRPDLQTPLEEQAATLDALYNEGKFAQLGVSNFRPDTLREYLDICESNGYVKPTVYQGDYSMINRGMETHLLPVLREHGIAFNAFRSVAAGFLSGSLTSGAKEGTRFGRHGYIGQVMNKLYDDESLHNAQRKLTASTSELGLTPIEAALRWAVYHSALQEQDGIILGASKEAQIVSNMKSIEKGPLPDRIVADIEEIWEELRAEKENNYIR